MRLFLLLFLCILSNTALYAMDEIENALNESIHKTTDPKKLYELYQALGNHYKQLGKKEAAESAYNKMRQFEATEALNQKIEHIKQLASEKYLPQAIQLLRNMLADYPDFTPARTLLALYLGWNREFSEADIEIDKVLTAVPGDWNARLIKADLLRWEGKNQGAIALYHELLAEKKDFSAQRGLIFAYLGQENLPEANRYFKSLPRPDSNQTTDYEELEKALAKANKESDTISKSLSEKQKAAEESDQDLQLAMEMANQQRYDEALALIDRFLIKKPQDFQGRLNKASVLRWSKHFKESIPIYLELLKEKENFTARLGLAWAYLQLQHWDEAKLNYRLLSPKLESEKKDVEELLAALNKEPSVEKENCEALKKRIMGLTESSKCAELYKKLGDCLARQGEEKEAVAVYKTILFYGDVYTLDERLEMINYLGQHEAIPDALDALKKVLLAMPKSIKARILYARFLSWDKKYEEALQQSESILQEDPENDETLLIKANVLRWTKKYEEALVFYQKILNKKEDFDARLGLAWNKINLECLDEAKKDIALLKPSYAYQIKEKKALEEGFEKEKKEIPKRKIQKVIEAANLLAEVKLYRQALAKLYTCLCDNPDDDDLRLTLAKVLSWSGRYRASLAWLRCILMKDPKNVDALIAAANVMRWKVSPASFCLYQRALSLKEENFYAKLGLAYALGARSWVNSAYVLANTLNIKEEYEKNDYADLIWSLPWQRSLNFKFYRYTDSDDIDTRKFSWSLVQWVCDNQLDLLYRYVFNTQPTAVTDHPTLFEASTLIEVDLLRSLNPCWDIAGGIGYATIRRDSRGDYLVGNLRANLFTECGKFSFASIYDVYVETAAALFFKIRTWANSISYANYLSGNCLVGGDYFYVYYSDANHSHRVDAFIKEKLYDCGFQVFAKYSQTYMDFASQPFSIFAVPSLFSGGHGYFDPKNYWANQLMFFCEYEGKKVHFTGYPFVGYVTYRLLGVHYNGPYIGAGMTVGLRFGKRLLLEATEEAAIFDLTHLTYTYHATAAWIKLAF